jgi:hypothetical protein
MIDMPASRSSIAQPKAAAAALAKKLPNKAAASKPAARSASRPGRSQAAEILREIQIDGKALSIQIERLRHRFL